VTAAAAIHLLDVIENSLDARRLYCAAASNYHGNEMVGRAFRGHLGGRFAPARTQFSRAKGNGLFSLDKSLVGRISRMNPR